jgi:8-oxo-dGTP diphosphatase
VVEYEETLEAAVVREVREETGYVVDLDRLLATDSFTDGDGSRPRPFKSVRVIYSAHIGRWQPRHDRTRRNHGSRCWIPLNAAVQEDPRAEIVDVAIQRWHRCVRTS